MQDFDSVVDVNAEPRRIPAMQGWQWIVNAFLLFKQSPAAWLGICGVFLLLFIGMNFMPFVGSLATTLLGPVFLGGLMGCAQKSARGETPEINDLFMGFKQNFAELFKVGVFYLLGTMVVVVAMVLMILAAGAIGLFEFDVSTKLDGQIGMILLIFVLFFVAFSIVYSAYFFAPSLVMLQGMTAGEAMKLSFLAFWRNWQPILLMSLIGAVLLLLAMLPFFLGLIVALPVAMLTSYVCYVDVLES